MRNYIFIVGSGRCGTTALANLLGSHPSISHTPELKFFSYVMAQRKVYEPLTFEKARSFFSEKAVGYILDFKGDIERSKSDAVRIFNKMVKLDDLKGLSRNEIYKKIYDMLIDGFQDKPAENVVIQTPNNLFYLDLAKDVLGKIKVIGMIREPKNFFVSAMRGDRRWYEKDVNAVLQWNVSSRYLDRISRSGKFDFILVKQEDFLLRPNDVLDRLSEFLSIDLGVLHDEEKLMVNSSFSTESNKEELFDRYKKHLTGREVHEIEYLCHKYMERFSYKDFQSNFKELGLRKKLGLKMSYLIPYIKLKIQIFMRQIGRAHIYIGIRDRIRGRRGGDL